MARIHRILPLIAGISVFSASLISAGPETVALPDSYQSTFVNYLDVDRYDRNRVRRMYVSSDAHTAAVAGTSLPDGTVLIMEDHDAQLDTNGKPVLDDNGRMIALEDVLNIFVMEKNSAWNTANENWAYAWYLADGSPRPETNFDGCFSCHNNSGAGL